VAGRVALILIMGSFAAAAVPGASEAVSYKISIPLTPGRSDVAGPVFAGDNLIWGRGAPGGYEIVTEGSMHEVQKLRIRGARHLYSPSFGARITASARRIGLSLGISNCKDASACKYEADETIFDGGFAGTLAHPFGRVAVCTRYDSRYGDEGTPPPVAVSDDIVAYDDCHVVHVHDYFPGAQAASREVPGGVGISLAGDYIAVDRSAQAGVVVTNWRTGQDLYSVKTDSFDVQDDGKLAFTTADGKLAWMSPGDPVQHVVVAHDTAAQIVDDRIAYEASDADGFGTALEERDLEGRLVAAARDDAIYSGFDFDGSRLTWITKPCVSAAVVVWDGVGRPPALRGQCPIPRYVRGSARLDARRHLFVRLRCPPRTGLGCPGVMTAVNPVAKERRLLGYDHYRLESGERRDIRVYKHHAFCEERHGRLRTKLVIWPDARAGQRQPRPQQRETIAVKGSLSREPSCG
jgi:hypothetical protein